MATVIFYKLARKAKSIFAYIWYAKDARCYGFETRGLLLRLPREKSSAAMVTFDAGFDRVERIS